MAEGGGLLNRYTALKPYREFESLPHRIYKLAYPCGMLDLDTGGEIRTAEGVGEPCLAGRQVPAKLVKKLVKASLKAMKDRSK